MKRVAIFRSDLLGVSETFIYEQARALSEWKPILVGFRNVKGGLDTSDIEKVVVDPDGNRFLSMIRFWLSRPVLPLVRVLNDLKVDLVHTHFATDATEIWPSVRATGLPMVVTLHGYDINIYREWWESGNEGLRRRIYPKRLLQMAHHPKVSFLAVSQAIRCRAIEYGIPEEKIAVSYIGVDTDRFKPGGISIDKRRNKVLFVGRMVPKKAPLLLIEALSEVRKRVPDAELTMIGDGPLRKETELAAKALDVPVVFLGAQNSDEIMAQLHESKVLCLPSIVAGNGDAEGFGMVILEAQSCGVPVVSSAVGGANEGLLDGVTGFRFSEASIDELARSLMRVLTDDELEKSLSIGARDFVKEFFDIKVTVNRMQKLYSSTLSKC